MAHRIIRALKSMPRRRRFMQGLVVLILLLAGLGGALMLIREPKVTPTATMAPVGQLLITARETITSGNDLTLFIGPVKTISGQLVPDNITTNITLLGGMQHGQYQVNLINGRGELTVPSEKISVAGVYIFRVTVGHQQALHTVTVKANQPQTPIHVLAAPRRIRTDISAETTLMAIPMDRYGNTLTDGIPFTFTVQHADGIRRVITTPISHQLAWASVPAGSQSGRAVAVGSIQTAYGPAVDFTESGGDPTNFAINATQTVLVADEISQVLLSAGPLKDAIGNLVSDGTVVQFFIRGPGKAQRQFIALSISGMAQVALPAAKYPGQAVVQAQVLNQSSKPLTITFTPGPAVGVIPININKLDWQQEVALTVGPIIGPLGELVGNGTDVALRIVSMSGSTIILHAELFEGFAHFSQRTRELEPGCYYFEVIVGEAYGGVWQSIPGQPGNNDTCPTERPQ